MKLILNIEKRYFFSILVVVLIVAGFLVANALTAGTAPNPGHVIENVSAPAGCQANQILQWTGSGWTCIDVPGSGSASFYGDKSAPLYIALDGFSANLLIHGVEYVRVLNLQDIIFDGDAEGYIRYNSVTGIMENRVTYRNTACDSGWVTNGGMANCTYIPGSPGNEIVIWLKEGVSGHALPVLRAKETQGTWSCGQTAFDYPDDGYVQVSPCFGFYA